MKKNNISFTFSHVGIVVKRLDIAIDYYVDVLGFKQTVSIMDEESIQIRVCFLRLGEAMQIELIEIKPGSSLEKVLNSHVWGKYHFCYHVENLDSTKEYLCKRKCLFLLDFQVPLKEGFQKYAYLLNPQRNLLEIVEGLQ
jgi:catechol 2,3-dioxygenase-like lactoylglutathione lyase family enzyme